MVSYYTQRTITAVAKITLWISLQNEDSLLNRTINKHFRTLEEFSELNQPKISFEFFPPKNDDMEAKLWNTIKSLESLDPSFVSVTYGAGGSTRERTRQTVSKIQNETKLRAAVHLTCVDATKDEINHIAKDYWDSGIKHIVALRGDSPDNNDYKPTKDGYNYASNLVAGLKEIADFEISVAAYPNTHPDATSAQDDIIHLKEKMDAGANRAITQYFFDTDDYLRFLDKTDKIGITKPIVPGILLIANFTQLVRFSKMCGLEVPKWIIELLEDTDKNPELRDIISAMIASEQCRILREAGIDQFHFYTLNRPTLALSVCRLLGIKP